MTRRRFNVLCIMDFFLPGYLGGGPITTIANMRKELVEQVALDIFTRDRDVGCASQYTGIVPNEWVEDPDGLIYYASPKNFGAAGFLRVLANGNFDAVYLNSFFSPKASILPILALALFNHKLPILLAPRGEFSPGALAISPYRKMIYIAITRLLGVYRGVFWHASTTREAEDIHRIFPKVNKRIFVAADSVLPESHEPGFGVSRRAPGCLRVVFVSRISPKKNLDGLIKILGLVSLPIQLDIYGPIEDEPYWELCTDLISKLPSNINVGVYGPLKPDSVMDTFSQYDLFAFPTHGENFGHVILESLRAGTPVVVSDQTPWCGDDDGALSVIPAQDVVRWRDALETAANRTAEEHKLLRDAALRYANRYVLEAETKKVNLELFAKVLNFRSDNNGAISDV